MTKDKNHASKVLKGAVKPPNAGKGRVKGVPNKVTGDIKAMILEALSEVGGVDYLVERANDPKTAAAFMGLVAKVLPMTIAGDPSAPLGFTIIERRVVDPSK